MATPDLDKKKLTPINPKLNKILDTNITDFDPPHITPAHVVKALSKEHFSSINNL